MIMNIFSWVIKQFDARAPLFFEQKPNISDTRKNREHNEPSIANLAWETKYLNIAKDFWGPFHDPIFLYTIPKVTITPIFLFLFPTIIFILYLYT